MLARLRSAKLTAKPLNVWLWTIVSSASVILSLRKCYDHKRTRYRLFEMLLALLRKSKLNVCLGWLVFTVVFPNLSSIASPLTDLTRKNRPNSIKHWQDHHEKEFQTLKNRLTSSPILRLPVFQENNSFVLRTDASDIGLGAVFFNNFRVKVGYP